MAYKLEILVFFKVSWTWRRKPTKYRNEKGKGGMTMNIYVGEVKAVKL
jgi:hypothetical protein